jgi:hypothetical protein
MELSRSQQLAQEYITNYARSGKNEAEQTIREILRMSNIELRTFEDAIAKLKSHTSIGAALSPRSIRSVHEKRC